MYGKLSEEANKIAKLRDRLGGKKIPHHFNNEYKCDYSIVYPYDYYRKYKVCLSYGEVHLIEYDEKHQSKKESKYLNIDECYKIIVKDWKKNKKKYKNMRNNA